MSAGTPTPGRGAPVKTVTPDELRALAATTTGAKYGNRRGVWVEEIGRRFDSQHEAEVAVGLVRREQTGEIRGLRFQERFPLIVNGRKVAVYVADFVWREDAPFTIESPYLTATGGRLDLVGWRQVVADAKGYRTALYLLKKKLMLACWGIEIVEL